MKLRRKYACRDIHDLHIMKRYHEKRIKELKEKIKYAENKLIHYDKEHPPAKKGGSLALRKSIKKYNERRKVK